MLVTGRKLPIGIQTFEDIRNDGYLYVDKTALMWTIANIGKPFFLSRPRRFGKSLLISTFEAYFKGRRDLFTGLAVEQLEKKWEEYPVLHLDLNAEKYDSPDRLDAILSNQLTQWEAIYGRGEDETTLSSRFLGVIRRASEQAGRGVVVLVDEYDKPLLQAIQNEPLLDSYRSTLKAFYGVSPIYNEDMTIHVGGYFNYQTPSGSGLEDKTVLFRTFPESRVDRRRFVQAEISNVNHYYTTGFELGFRYRKLLTYGEYIYNNISRYTYGANNQKTDLKNAVFNGWYATASYMILGENRQYSPDEAEFGPMKMRRKGGNLEVAARISNINMNDFHDPAAYITGGKATSYSASLNWYPVRNVVIGLNYIYMNNDKYADSKGQITKGGKPLSEVMPSGIDFNVFQLRTMISF